MAYLITDRQKLRPNQDSDLVRTLVGFIEQAFRSGIDMVQIRERDLPARTVYKITFAACQIASRLAHEEEALRAGTSDSCDQAGVDAGRPIQLRDKTGVGGRASLAMGFRRRVLVNDRADLAVAAGAGVHLTTRSIDTSVIRR
ncbi:MAG TPA: thiamine phosphate synthase, partial [Blastocatellia bacterium]